MDDQPPLQLRIMCVDDNELLAEALGRRLRCEPDFLWVGVIIEGAHAFDRIVQAAPDIVLLDIDMPDLDSFRVVEELAEKSADIRVLMFSGHVSQDYIRRAVDSGAWGYLSKNDDIDRLILAIRRAHSGEVVFSKEVEAVMKTH